MKFVYTVVRTVMDQVVRNYYRMPVTKRTVFRPAFMKALDFEEKLFNISHRRAL